MKSAAMFLGVAGVAVNAVSYVHMDISAATGVINVVNARVHKNGLPELERMKSGSVLISGPYAVALYLAASKLGVGTVPALDHWDFVAIGHVTPDQPNTVIVTFYRRRPTPPPPVYNSGTYTFGCGDEVPFIIDLRTNAVSPGKKVC